MILIQELDKLEEGGSVKMKADEVLKLLEKHEAQCDKRYAEIQDKLKSLDGRVWGLYGVIIGVAVLEKIF